MNYQHCFADNENSSFFGRRLAFDSDLSFQLSSPVNTIHRNQKKMSATLILNLCIKMTREGRHDGADTSLKFGN